MEALHVPERCVELVAGTAMLEAEPISFAKNPHDHYVDRQFKQFSKENASATLRFVRLCDASAPVTIDLDPANADPAGLSVVTGIDTRLAFRSLLIAIRASAGSAGGSGTWAVPAMIEPTFPPPVVWREGYTAGSVAGGSSVLAGLSAVVDLDISMHDWYGQMLEFAVRLVLVDSNEAAVLRIYPYLQFAGRLTRTYGMIQPANAWGGGAADARYPEIEVTVTDPSGLDSDTQVVVSGGIETYGR